MSLKLSVKQLQLLEATIDLSIQEADDEYTVCEQDITDLKEIHKKVLAELAYKIMLSRGEIHAHI
jgi:hypothetical protein